MHNLIVTRLGGPQDDNPNEIIEPSWEDIEAALRKLDGESCSLVVLGIGDPPVPHMAIGGGNGKYIVYATADNAVFHKAMNTRAPDRKCSIVAGGQRGMYDLRMCVTFDQALRAAETYALTGTLDPSLSWET
jgi:immunity protein Imm1 of predicted polymorphic toxin system